MNRVIFKETNKCHLCVDVILYLSITILGFIILLSNCLKDSILYNLYSIFYIIGILSLIAYFINRRKEDYESLLFCLINIFVGTFALLNYNYFNEYVILSLCIFIHTICNTANKWYQLSLLDDKKDFYIVSKASMTFLFAVLGLFVSINIYFRTLKTNEFLGYYFIAFGLLSLLEPFMKILIRNNNINNYLIQEDKKEKNIKLITKEKIKPAIMQEKKKVVKKKTTTKKVTKKK